MTFKEIPDSTIELVSKHINHKTNKNYKIPVIQNPNNIETPQYFEIFPFDEIDNTESKFFAVDGSYNSQEFYNGLYIGIYTGGYICYSNGKQLRLNDLDDPIILGKSYLPNNVLITNEDHKFAIYDELLTLEPVNKLLSFFNENPENIFPYDRETICRNVSTLLSFCQEILEWSLIFEIANLSETKKDNFILRDGTLRSLNIKQKYLVSLGEFIKQKGVIVVAITKQSPIKMELSYTFKQIDNYLQDNLKPKYPFKQNDPKRQKLCCWLEIPETVLISSYGTGQSSNMYSKKNIKGGRGLGLFTAARLDYVEKLQNYDWLIVDINIFDAIPDIKKNNLKRDQKKLDYIFKELTRLTQEHYILGYPYPLVEAHNFVTLKKDFKEEIIKRVKFSLYKNQQMDNVDIENLFLDIHDRF